MRSFLILALAGLALGPMAVAAQESSSQPQGSETSSSASEDEEMLETVPVKENEVAEDEEELSTTYSTIGLSKVAADFDNVDDAINIDFTLIGFRIPTLPSFGIELVLGGSIIPGKISEPAPQSGCGGLLEPPCENQVAGEGDFGVTTIGAFAAYRSPGKFFGMGRLGYRYVNSNLPELQEERQGTAWGIGGGYRWNKRGSFAELGYTKWSEKIDGIGFTVSYSYDRR